LKGPVGTQQDLLDLFEGDNEKVSLIENRVAEILGFDKVLDSVGQVYPRSMDFEVVSALVHISSAPSNFSKTVRLMAGNNLVSEGFQQGQVGSSAMPHKTNTRTSERINGLSLVLKGYLSMLGGLVGDQWNEGDVSCSVVRRVALPDSFFAIDGLFQSFLTVLDEFGSFPAVIEKELLEELPYLSTTRLLVAAVQKGIGRETAHEIISEHAQKSSISRREGLEGPSFVELLDSDDRFPLNEGEMNQLFSQRTVLIGNASNQVQLVIEKIADIVTHRPLAASYKPESII
jgi:adenylosuccinate lyase